MGQASPRSPSSPSRQGKVTTIAVNRTHMRDSRGLIYSTALHGILALLLIVGLPSFFHHEVDMEPEVVSVDILPIAPMSNVKPEDEAKKEKVAKEETAPKTRPETHEKVQPKE